MVTSFHRLMLSVSVLALLSGCATVERTDESPFVARKAATIQVDGKLNESAWRNAHWVELTGYMPDYAGPVQKDNIIRGAFLWNETGLYVGIDVADQDVQANKTTKNDWIWLEDVCEVFFSRSNTGDAPHLELQVNANGTVFEELMIEEDAAMRSVKRSGYIPEYTVAVNVNGTLNCSAEKDTGWSAEWAFGWDELKNAGVLSRDGIPHVGDIVSYARLCNWNIDIYTVNRVLRYTRPGNHDPHYPAHYRPVILEAK